jgi:hypothetical protein
LRIQQLLQRLDHGSCRALKDRIDHPSNDSCTTGARATGYRTSG